jgi:hypothetical protein
MVAAAAIPLVLGTAHLVLTWRGPKLTPADPAVTEAMRGTSAQLNPATNIWRLWVGFNASHGIGAVQYGLVFGILALTVPDVLFTSWPLMIVAIAVPVAYLLVGLKYWFRIPTTGVGVTAALAIAAVTVAQIARLT